MFFISCIVAFAVNAKVTVDLVAPIKEYCGSTMLETSSWLYEQSPTLFWSFMKNLASEPISLSTDVASKLVPSHMKAFMDEAVESRLLFNHAGVYKNLYEAVKDKPVEDGCTSWIQYGSNLLCDASKIDKLVDRLSNNKLTGCKLSDISPHFDRVYSKDLTGLPILILWADPAHTATWASLFSSLFKYAEGADISLVVRFIVKSNGCDLAKEKIHLGNYGAIFEVKNEDVKQANMSETKGIYEAVGIKSSSLDDQRIVTSLEQSDQMSR